MVTDLSVACTFFDLMALAKALFRVEWSSLTYFERSAHILIT